MPAVGVDTVGRDAVFEAWHALSGAIRSWGIQSREDLSEWIHRQGFVQPRWGGHFRGRAQERILTTAVLTDARVSALESTYVQVVLRACGQTTPLEAPHNGASARHGARVRQDESVPNHPDRCWEVMDEVNLQDVFHESFSTLQSCPQSFRGRYRHACRQVLEVRHDTVNSRDELMEERAWKAFCLLPLLLFRRPGNERNVSKEELRRRFDLFTNGMWEILVDEAVATLPVPVKPRSEAPLSTEQRGEKAAQKVQLGEITRARQCLTGATPAPGNDNTFNELQRKRPQEVVRELPEHVRAFTPETPLVFNKEILLKSLKTSPRGSSPGPGGCTYEHLKVLMDDVDTFNLLHEAVTSLAQGRVPASISKALTMARLTAVTKKDGGVRGIATGCSLRRLTARTLAKQFAKDFESECAPFQFALSTRAGTDCVGHLLRAATDVNPNATVLSVDGVGAYDHILRAAMMNRLARMPNAKALLPFVLLSYSAPSEYDWHDDEG